MEEILFEEEKDLATEAGNGNDGERQGGESSPRRMFSAPFSAKGRIRRLEYCLSVSLLSFCLSSMFAPLYAICAFICEGYFRSEMSLAGIVLVLFFFLIWIGIGGTFLTFIIFQGIKRCHDLGKSGWWQLIPFYVLWLILARGQEHDNEYGENLLKADQLFYNPFSFEGRISNYEFILSMPLVACWCGWFAYFSMIPLIFITLIFSGANAVASSADMFQSSLFFFGLVFVGLVLLVSSLWFIFAQNAKRCHDLGNPGWWQLIPFYGLWLLFAAGDRGENEYGESPKA